jgi:hypothetical protein
MKEFMVLPGIHVVYPPIGISYGISMDELLFNLRLLMAYFVISILYQ